MASITCGNCTGKHASVQEVRACYGDHIPAAPAMRPADPTPIKVGGPTPKQVDFLTSLAEERPTWAEANNVTPETIAKMDKRQASDAIGSALQEPKEKLVDSTAPPALAAEVPEGRYAVEDGQTLRFIHVQRPTEGKWAGYLFMKEQASDEKFPIRNKGRRDMLLALIVEQGVHDCLARYGKELGHCGVCGRTLTDEQSRERGIGPVCWSAL